MAKKIGRPKKVKRDKNGRFIKGSAPANPKGRPPSSNMEKLLDAIDDVQKKENKNIFEHFVEQAFLDNKVLIALFRKLIADIKYVDSADGSDITELHVALMKRLFTNLPD